MRSHKLKQRLQTAFGKVPDVHYFAGDMDYIRAYYDFRQENGLDPFLLDDITWNDLNMDQVFKRINQKRCTSGEQYLYYMLRTPALDAEDYERRRALIQFAQSDPQRRLKLELILARLGCRRRADLCRAFYPSAHGIGKLLFYLALFLFFVCSVAAALLRPHFGALCLLLSITLNLYLHEFRKRRSLDDFDTVNYGVSMIFAMRRLRALHDAELDAHLRPAYESLDRLQSVIRTGGVTAAANNGGLEDIVLSITLLDLITYEFLKNKLGRCRDDVFTIHEHLGRLDAAISVASYRASVDSYVEPALCFDAGAPASIRAVSLIHPLLSDPVANDLITERSILITGSNASGKSTYLKTAALAAIMAQSIGTVLAQSYEASAFCVLTSMALNDNLLGGESYYIVETRSLKRILDASKAPAPLLCVVDEVLRGTNTVERIAASSEVLQALSDGGTICLAATHDIELCELLSGSFRMFHFEEQVGRERMQFDYRIREGKATTRNAINLLRLLGFDEQIVQNAHARADRYLERGSWSLR